MPSVSCGVGQRWPTGEFQNDSAVREPTEFDIGGVWDDSEWRIFYDDEADSYISIREGQDSLPPSPKRCPHATNIREDPPVVHPGDPERGVVDVTEVVTRWVVPRVVVATNEGGYNSTGVCLDCILDAAKTL